MKYDYFYAEGSEQFTFYRLPKALFTDEAFACLSCEAKLLYGILLDRMCLSAKNGWTDGEGRVYIIYTVAEIREAMSCSDKKALKMLDELEHGCGLIRRKRQGLGKPNLIYVGNFSSAEGKLMNRNNDTSGAAENTIQEQSEITIQEVSELRCNNTYINKTDNNDTDNNNTDSVPNAPSCEGKPTLSRYAAKDRIFCRRLIRENTDYDVLICDEKVDPVILNRLLDIMVEAVCTSRSCLRVDGKDIPADTVRSRFLTLSSEHIRFVLDSIRGSSSIVSNTRQYILTALYNAPLNVQAQATARG